MDWICRFAQGKIDNLDCLFQKLRTGGVLDALAFLEVTTVHGGCSVSTIWSVLRVSQKQYLQICPPEDATRYLQFDDKVDSVNQLLRQVYL